MENMGDWVQKHLVNELIMGRELTRQLQVHLSVPSSPKETIELLVQKILSSHEKALSMLCIHPTGITGTGISDSPPPSLSGSPKSDQDSDRELKDQDPADASRNRKIGGRWTKQVRVNPGMGLEGPLDDGFSWRKYGQKNILGAKYPRGYYRCTHRIVQGCLATKQVQRSDEDPTIFEITYRGRHTCTQVLHHSQPAENSESHSSLDPQQQQQQPHENQHFSQDLLWNLRSGLKVVTEGLDHHEHTIPPFQFPPSTSNVKPEMAENNFMGNFSPSFISPSTSGNTNYFSASSTGMHHSYGGNQSFQTSDSDLTDIIAAAASTSATNSPTVGTEHFPLGNVEFDPKYFSFHNHGFFS